MNIFWFRRDLRLDDNHGLYKALSKGDTLPIFIFDTNILDGLPKNDKRVNFIYDSLETIQKALKSRGKSLHIFHGDPLAIFKKITETHVVQKVYCNEDFEPYGIQRDRKVQCFLQSKSIEFQSYVDHLIFSPDTILKQDQSPYTVYTPYSKKWKHRLENLHLKAYRSEKCLDSCMDLPSEFPSLTSLGFLKTPYDATYQISKIFLSQYSEDRNTPSLSTSHLGIHLRFGSLSIRKIVQQAQSYETFLNELIWREFFIQILYHFPQVIHESFRKKYDAIKWRNNPSEFEKWKKGITGYPLVDAGMRELNETGFMHNRVRMLTASFLCKHLLIDWRWGEAYFAEKLLDFELASNNGNWQWAAGTGCDAAPYFRVFNPSLQAEKFDPERIYIQKWVPEIDGLQYPTPMVDHQLARKRAIETYKKYLNPM